MKKILIVDDDVDLVEATRLLLESKGYAVISGHGGADGMELARKEKPDLMLLDVMMKHDSEGFEVARQLKADPATAKLPVIMVTGVRRSKRLPFQFEPDADWLPVKAILEKPVKPESLLKAIGAALGK
jgi:two-component system alkaline phosphatase synthesis response regulator PhoP